MPTIKLIDSFDRVLETHPLQVGEPLALELMRVWPTGFPGETVFVVGPDGSLMDAHTACGTLTEINETYVVALRPQGPAVIGFLGTTVAGGTALGAALGITWGSLALTAVSLLGSYLLAPKLPQINDPYQWEDETQPQWFSAQSNHMRIGSRVPEVFGIVRVWPDLIAEPWIRFEGATQKVDELYVISNGLVTITDARIHDEPTDGLDVGTAPQTWVPGDPWPIIPGQADGFQHYRSNPFVGAAGSIPLPAPNDDPGDLTLFTISGSTMTSDDPQFFDGFVDFVGSYFALTERGSAPVALANRQAMYQVASAAGNTLTITGTFPVNENDKTAGFRGATQVATSGGVPTNFAFNWRPVYPYWYADAGARPDPTSYASDTTITFDESMTGGTLWQPATGAEGSVGWTNGTITSYDSGDISSPVILSGGRLTRATNSAAPAGGYLVNWTNNGIFAGGGAGEWNSTATFGVPGDNIDRIQFDVEFPNGLFEQAASGATAPYARSVTIAMYHRIRTDDDSNPWVKNTFTLTAEATRTVRRFTSQLDVTPGGQYEVYFERESDSVPPGSATVAQDAAQLIGVRGRQVPTQKVLDDILECTVVKLDLSTQNIGEAVQNRSYSMVAERWLPNRRPGGDGMLIATSKIYDAVLYTLVDQGLYNVDHISRQELWDIQTDLDAIGEGAGEFHGIIDQSMSAEDQARMILRIGRISMYRRGSVIHFSRLKAGMVPRYLVNARNKTEPEVKTLHFGDTNDATSVIVRFMDASNDYEETTVQYPDPVSDPGATINPEDQAVIGITNLTQAYRTARYAWDQREYSRDVVEVPMNDDGMMVSPGDVLAVTDHLRTEKPFDGEIVFASVGTYTFDRPIPAGNYVARLTDDLGDIVGNGAITLAEESLTVDMSAIWPAAPTPPNTAAGTGLRYTFTPDVRDEFDLMYVAEMAPSRDGPVNLQCIVYNEEAFAADTWTPPTQPNATKRRG